MLANRRIRAGPRKGDFMTGTNGGQGNQQGNRPDTAVQEELQPQLNVVGQYIKDLSFENPNAPKSLSLTQQPQIGIQINVAATPLSDTDLEVSLKLEGRAEANGNLVFGFELDYAGVFRVRNVPPESRNAVVLIECPRLLFPFAREIIANTVRNGGFPPLMLDPVDFVALYRQKMAETQPVKTPTV
jgi:preprotein translocase subunit SecB